jgi:hypothetical protein
MQVKYTVEQQPREFELSGSSEEDIGAMCTEIESRLRADHADLSGQEFLTEKIADALLNNLADGVDVIDLGEFSR